MRAEVEIDSLDLRYQGYRMKNSGLEGRLLASIAQRGIEEALEGVDLQAGPVLLNGFKRYRCARRLGLSTVPYACLGQDEVLAIVNLLRIANNRALSILEQARFLDELKNVRGMSLAEIATQLCRSKAWVSMRLSLLAELSPVVQEKLFSGAFPIYAFMYHLRPFMRMNGVTRAQVDQFVTAVSGQHLSVRDIEQLAHAYFRGPESLRQQIASGNLALPLERLKQVPTDPEACSPFEQALLSDLTILQKYLQRALAKSQDPRLQSRAFHAQCHLLTAGILSSAPALFQTLRELHDRNGKA